MSGGGKRRDLRQCRCGSACSTTSRACSRTPTAWARWKPRGWRPRISTAAARTSRSRSSMPTTRTRPMSAHAIARKWLDVEGVDAIVDVPNSAVGLSINTLLRDSRMTFLASSTASSDLTGKACSPNTIQWVNDAWATGNTTAAAMMARGGKDWYFLTVDYALGKGIEAEAHQIHRGARRQGAWLLEASARHLRFRLLPVAGAGLQSAGDRPRQCRRRHHQRGEAGCRVRHPAEAGRSSSRSCSSSTTSMAWASRSPRASS